MKGHWFLDRRFMIAVVSIVFILPWLFPKRIGILSYTRCVEGGRERERERERDVMKAGGAFNYFLEHILI